MVHNLPVQMNDQSVVCPPPPLWHCARHVTLIGNRVQRPVIRGHRLLCFSLHIYSDNTPETRVITDQDC